MNSNELIKEKMLELGASKQQTESKTLEIMLVALAEVQKTSDFNYKEAYWEIINRYKKAEMQMDEEKNKWTIACMAKLDEKNMFSQRNADYKRFVSNLIDITEMLLALDENLVNAETAEQRDTIRKAVYFQDNTTINTCYDNTAFIRGLGNILSGAIEPEQDLKLKKNPKETPEKYDTGMKQRLTEILKELNDIQEENHQWENTFWGTLAQEK